MGRPRKRLQTGHYDGRKFTTIPVTRNGRVSYHRSHLRTKDENLARRRLTALDSISDPEEVRGSLRTVCPVPALGALSACGHAQADRINGPAPQSNAQCAYPQT